MDQCKSNDADIIKAKSGIIFGDYTEQEWHSKGGFVTDPNAFIFSLVNKEEKPFKALPSFEHSTSNSLFSLLTKLNTKALVSVNYGRIKLYLFNH